MTWTQEEVNRYKEVRRRELGPLYALKKLSIDNPAERYRFLYNLGLFNMTDSAVVRETEKKDKVKALKILEDLAVEEFF